MSPDKLRSVLVAHDIVLAGMGGDAVEFNDATTPSQMLQHARWMCQRACSFVDDGRLEKANRWLGFIQGVLWVCGVATIDEMRDLNRTEVEGAT
jgi:hypothetical protein